jgi:hypothetical protein
MPEHYPVPSYAVYAWLAGDRLVLGLPPRKGFEKGHSVSIPLTNEKWSAVLLDILRERGREVRPLGTKSTPVQYDLDNILKHLREARESERRAKKAEARDFLKEIGL